MVPPPEFSLSPSVLSARLVEAMMAEASAARSLAAAEAAGGLAPAPAPLSSSHDNLRWAHEASAGAL